MAEYTITTTARKATTPENTAWKVCVTVVEGPKFAIGRSCYGVTKEQASAQLAHELSRKYKRHSFRVAANA